jgi:hypothetical protein
MDLNKEKWLTSFGMDKSPKSQIIVLKLMRQLFPLRRSTKWAPMQAVTIPVAAKAELMVSSVLVT